MPATVKERENLHLLTQTGQNVDITTRNGAKVRVTLRPGNETSVIIKTKIKKRKATMFLPPGTQLPLCEQTRHEMEEIIIDTI